jgi:hypothetical protein
MVCQTIRKKETQRNIAYLMCLLSKFNHFSMHISIKKLECHFVFQFNDTEAGHFIEMYWKWKMHFRVNYLILLCMQILCKSCKYIRYSDYWKGSDTVIDSNWSAVLFRVHVYKGKYGMLYWWITLNSIVFQRQR